jgi:hypothetical protein
MVFLIWMQQFGRLSAAPNRRSGGAPPDRAYRMKALETAACGAPRRGAQGALNIYSKQYDSEFEFGRGCDVKTQHCFYCLADTAGA